MAFHPGVPDTSGHSQWPLVSRAHLRRLKARSLEDLWRAVGTICDLFDPTECWNDFKAAGHAHD
jgi:hypothetical protein